MHDQANKLDSGDKKTLQKYLPWQNQRLQENALQTEVRQDETSEGEVSKLERQSLILTDYCNSGCQGDRFKQHMPINTCLIYWATLDI